MQCNGYTLFLINPLVMVTSFLHTLSKKKIEVFAIIEHNILAIHNTHKRILINLSKVIENWLVIIYHSG